MINEKKIKRICNEDPCLIENYDKAILDTTETWHCHHRLEIELNKTCNELINLNLYYHRPASELIFLTRSEHISIHKKGIKISDAHKKKICIATKGSNNGFYGKQHSEETKSKMRKSKPKFNWITPSGEIKSMSISHVKQWHPDWVLIE